MHSTSSFWDLSTLYPLVFPCCIVLHYINNTVDLIRSHTSYKYCLPQIYISRLTFPLSQHLYFDTRISIYQPEDNSWFPALPFPNLFVFQCSCLLMTPFTQLCKNQNGDGDTFCFFFSPDLFCIICSNIKRPFTSFLVGSQLETQVWYLVSGGNGHPPQYSCLGKPTGSPSLYRLRSHRSKTWLATERRQQPSVAHVCQSPFPSAPAFPPWYLYVCSQHLYFCFANKIICTISLDSTYMC